MPFALDRKYPNTDRLWIWQWVFPSSRRIQNPDTETWQRYHLHESGLQKALKQATRTAHLTKRIGCHTFATHLLQNGYDAPSKNSSGTPPRRMNSPNPLNIA